MKKQKLDWKDHNGRLVKRGELLIDLEFTREGGGQLGAEARRAGVPERREEVEAEGRLRQGMGGWGAFSVQADVWGACDGEVQEHGRGDDVEGFLLQYDFENGREG